LGKISNYHFQLNQSFLFEENANNFFEKVKTNINFFSNNLENDCDILIYLIPNYFKNINFLIINLS